MGLIDVVLKGNTNKLETFLAVAKKELFYAELGQLAEQGVAALEAATPRDSGITAGSWSYEIEDSLNGKTIKWKNSSKDASGTPIVILLQYGHGTGTGGYVAPIDFINPATQETFDNISDAVWKAVQSA